MLDFEEEHARSYNELVRPAALRCAALRCVALCGKCTA